MASENPFTALILITSETKPNVEERILETLAPFTIKILDKKSMSIRDRYFLAIYFSLDKAHANAIENDLVDVTKLIGVDLAIDYQIESQI